MRLKEVDVSSLPKDPDMTDVTGYITGNGLTNRKCLDCKGGESMSEEKKEVLYCKPCGTEIKEGEKYFKNTGECKKCYQARWCREKRVKEKLAPPKAAMPVKPEPVRKVKPAPANGSDSISSLRI